MTSPQDILTVHQAFYDAFEQMDIDAMGRIWSKGTSAICIHPGRSALRGWDQIRFAWEQIFQHTRQMDVKADILTTEVSDTLAYMVVVENLVQVVPERRLEVQTMATNVFERMGNTWYMVLHHGSPLMR
ncbi:MAG: nuclear transport factor 2 family protein [Synechococcales cyanobacterium C42_A2020_086]|jgi:ketosteroid isomerase-like protein|nr:nuclear transport factor 2 family protein [Synechococcales cyanobacterium M58_A2018_015]MBF2073865.1 nuclear transport factor 2 family protein [Synechococcales cyanobacterium C42_A2020_086]